MCIIKLSFDDLDGLLWQLTLKLWDGKLDTETYLKEWDALMAFAGWTENDYLSEIDGRWTTERRSHVVFLC